MAIIPSEKRSFPRIKLHTPVHYRIRGLGESNNTVSNNISLKGIGIINDRFIAPQTSVMLEINLLSHILRPIGRIAWASPLSHSDRYHVGIEFLELGPRENNYLKNFINIQNAA